MIFFSLLKVLLLHHVYLDIKSVNILHSAICATNSGISIGKSWQIVTYQHLPIQLKTGYVNIEHINTFSKIWQYFILWRDVTDTISQHNSISKTHCGAKNWANIIMFVAYQHLPIKLRKSMSTLSTSTHSPRFGNISSFEEMSPTQHHSIMAFQKHIAGQKLGKSNHVERTDQKQWRKAKRLLWSWSLCYVTMLFLDLVNLPYVNLCF